MSGIASAFTASALSNSPRSGDGSDQEINYDEKQQAFILIKPSEPTSCEEFLDAAGRLVNQYREQITFKKRKEKMGGVLIVPRHKNLQIRRELSDIPEITQIK